MTATVPRAALEAIRWIGQAASAGVGWLCRLTGFVLEPVDALLTARIGVPPVLPRLRRWGQFVAAEWRAYRAAVDGSVIEADVIEDEGVWR